MMKKIPYLFILALGLLGACNQGSNSATSTDAISLTIKNPADFARKDVLLKVDISRIAAKHPGFDGQGYRLTSGADLPFQLNDLDADGAPDEIAFLADLAPNEEKTVSFVRLGEGESLPEFKKRTQAELSHKTGGKWEDRKYIGGDFQNVQSLRVPPEHTDHSFFIRYEGPGWESDKVGYRFYLDWRNATDIFGKKTEDMVLQRVGLDGFDSYHEPGEWGMDILKVGPSLGIGTPGTWLGDAALRVETTDSVFCAIPLNGVVESMVRTRYAGWKAGDQKVDLTSELTIGAGSRMTRNDLTLSAPLPNLCTGLVKLDNAAVLKDDGSRPWGYFATFGNQSLAEDGLGMAILYRQSDLIQVTEDKNSHVVVLRPDQNKLTYYFLAAWEQEPGGIRTEEAFRKYLDDTALELGQPVSIEIN